MAIDLDSLSSAELLAFLRSAEAQMESARKHQVHEVRTKVDALLKGAGLTVDEVYPQRDGKGASRPSRRNIATPRMPARPGPAEANARCGSPPP